MSTPGEKAIRSAVTVGPGDILVIRISPRSTTQQLDRLMARIREALPPEMKGRVMVVEAEQLGVVKP